MTVPAACKKVLIVQYSQTGQLARMADALAGPLQDGGIEVERLLLRPLQPFPFPWSFFRFFDAFPETVHLRPASIETPRFGHERYDLIIIAYTVWFLSPAQPVTAFVQHPAARTRLQGTPVMTLIGCRNMWLMAQEVMKQLLDDAGARLVDNVVKIDACNSAWSLLTTPLWMFTGRRQAAGWMPLAGIADGEITDCARFGGRIREVLMQGAPICEPMLRGMGAVRVNERLILSERVARRSFRLWGGLLLALGRVSHRLRRLGLCVYVLFLVGIILTVLPVSALLKTLAAPLMRQRIQRQKQYFSLPSGE